MSRTTVPKSKRKHSAAHYVRSVLGQVWRHPSNKGRRVRAIAGAAGWQVYKRVTGRPITISFGDYRIRCYPDTGSAANVIYFSERFDPTEFAFLDRYLRPGDNVADVGANVGLYALWAAQLIGPAGRVDAFEAVPRTAERLRENVALNRLEDRVFVHEAAAAAEAGEVEFTLDFDVSNSIVPAGTAASSASRVQRVAAVTLDGTLSSHRYALGKVDVEGAEVMALTGWAEALTQGNPPVLLLEVLSGQLTRQGTSVAALVELLADFGYSIFEFDAERRELVNGPSVEEAHGNVIAVHRSSLDDVRARLAAG